jgi:outer membrane protein OmpA-like peptidoglycan-associated protein
LRKLSFFLRASKSAFLLFAVCFFFTQTVSLYAQQNVADEMETLLETSAVTYGQAARLVLEASGEVNLSSAGEAFSYAAEKDWLPKNVSADTEARLDGIAMLIMHSFKFEGGMMYSLTKNPHYSYQELMYKKLIQGRTDPAMKTPGSLLLFVMGRTLAYRQQLLADAISRQLRRMKISDVEVRIIDEGIAISLFNVQFLPDSTVLTDSEKLKLDNIAQILNNIEEIRESEILVGGHTAMAGTEDGRVEISWGRAQAVASYIISTGVRSTADVSVVGYGGERPLRTGSSPEIMAANRRVEITILE